MRAIFITLILGALCTAPEVRGQRSEAGDQLPSLGARILDLGTLPGGLTSSATAINSAGAIVGSSEASIGSFTATHAFYWNEDLGAMVDLGTLPPATGVADSFAFAINDRRQVVGVSENASGIPHALLFEVGASGQVTARTDLGTLPDFPESVALGINEKSQVVGVAIRLVPGGQQQRAFFWSQSTGITDLGSLGGPNSSAMGINDQGDVVGLSQTPNEQLRGFKFRVDDQGNVLERIVLEPPDTPDAFFSTSTAAAINSSGQIAGAGKHLVVVNPLNVGLFWPQPDEPVEIGTLPSGQTSELFGINDLGFAVGKGDTTAGGVPRGIVWSADTGMHDLSQLVGTTFFEVLEARGINRAGQIAATGVVIPAGTAIRPSSIRNRPRPRGGSGGNEHALSLELCSADVTRNVRVHLGPVRRAGGHGPKTFSQDVVLRNPGNRPILGLIRLVVGNLPANATLLTRTGITVCTAPGGEPYVDVGDQASLPAGEKLKVSLRFSADRQQAIRFRPRVLAGGIVP